jgi:MoxR-like ATPase
VSVPVAEARQQSVWIDLDRKIVSEWKQDNNTISPMLLLGIVWNEEGKHFSVVSLEALLSWVTRQLKNYKRDKDKSLNIADASKENVSKLLQVLFLETFKALKSKYFNDKPAEMQEEPEVAGETPPPNPPVDQKPEFRIFHGPPGTGKTTEAKDNARKSGRLPVVVQIHPSFTYEDLIEGLKPVTFANGDLKYEIVEGPIKIYAHKGQIDYPASILARVEWSNGTAVIGLPIGTTARYGMSKIYLGETKELDKQEYQSAQNDQIVLKQEAIIKLFPSIEPLISQAKTGVVYKKIFAQDLSWGTRQYCLILDEINRGNISQILGELVFALAEQDSYSPEKVTLQYSGEEFAWPKSISLYGTMNTADTSTERLDQAVKRRFSLEYVGPYSKLLEKGNETFPFLGAFNKAYAEEMDETPVPTLDGLFKFFGTEKTTPKKLLDDLNNILEKDASDLNVIHPSDKLIGHSYFIKLCRQLCEQAPSLPGKRKVILFHEAMNMFQGALTPSLLSVLNHDESALARFYQKLTGGKPFSSNANTDAMHEELVGRIFFPEDKAVVVDFQEFKKKLQESGKRVARN